MEHLRYVALRKLLHVALSSLLLVPYIVHVSYISYVHYYIALAVTAAGVNSLLIKKPLLSGEIRKAFESRRRKAFEAILRSSPPYLKELLDLESKIRKLEAIIQEQLSMMEREYEKKGGYIGIEYGVIGVLFSQIFFGERTFYGVLALMIVDPIAAVVGYRFGRHRVPPTGSSLEGMVAASAAYMAFLLALGLDPARAFGASIITCAVELLSVEDNLTLPIASSFLASFLDFPKPPLFHLARL